MAKKSPFEIAVPKFSRIHFSAPDVFAYSSLSTDENYAHGWQSGPTDKEFEF